MSSTIVGPLQVTTKSADEAAANVLRLSTASNTFALGSCLFLTAVLVLYLNASKQSPAVTTLCTLLVFGVLLLYPMNVLSNTSRLRSYLRIVYSFGLVGVFAWTLQDGRDASEYAVLLIILATFSTSV